MADNPQRPSSRPNGAWKRRARKASFLPPREFVSALQFMVFLALLGAGGARWFGAVPRRPRASLFALAFTARTRGPRT